MNTASNEDGDAALKGDLIDEIIRMSDFSFERLPMLDIIGSRMADFLPAALSDLTRSVCEAALTNLEYLPLGQAIEGFPDPVLVAVAGSPVLEGNYLIVMDAPLVMSCLELSLGGRAVTRKTAVDIDEFTAIEKGFGSRLAELTLGELRQSFSVVGDIVPELTTVESNSEAAVVAQQASLCVRLDFELQIGANIGHLQLIFPYDTLEPIRPQLGKVYFGERGDEDSPWRDVLAKQIESATVELEIVLTEQRMFMRKIMELEPGQILELPVGEDHESTVTCSGSALFKCVPGKRSNGLAAIRIVEEIESKEEIPDGGSNH